MEFLMVQDVNGRIVGNMMLEDVYKDLLEKDNMLVTSILNKSKSKVVGYTLLPVEKVNDAH